MFDLYIFYFQLLIVLFGLLHNTESAPQQVPITIHTVGGQSSLNLSGNVCLTPDGETLECPLGVAKGSIIYSTKSIEG